MPLPVPLIKLGIFDVVGHILRYMALIVSVPGAVRGYGCPVNIVQALSGYPKLVLVSTEVIEFDLESIRRLAGDQVGVGRQGELQFGGKAALHGGDLSGLIRILVEGTVHHQPAMTTAQEFLGEGRALVAGRVVGGQHILLLLLRPSSEITDGQSLADRSKVGALHILREERKHPIAPSGLKNIGVGVVSVKTCCVVLGQIPAIGENARFDLVCYGVFVRCGMLDDIAEGRQNGLLENPGGFVIHAGAVERMLGVEHHCAVGIALEHVHGKESFREGIDPAHILIAWLAIWLKELSIARLIPGPSIGQCAPVICQASQPCAHSEATHCIKAGAGGALGVDDKVLVVLLSGIMQFICVVEPLLHHIRARLINIGQYQIAALLCHQLQVLGRHLCHAYRVAVVVVLREDDALDTFMGIDECDQLIIGDGTREIAERGSSSHQREVDVDVLFRIRLVPIIFFCLINEIAVPCPKPVVVAVPAVAVTDKVIGVELDGGVRLEIIRNIVPDASDTQIALGGDASGLASLPPVLLLGLCVDADKQKGMLLVHRHTRCFLHAPAQYGDSPFRGLRTVIFEPCDELALPRRQTNQHRLRTGGIHLCQSIRFHGVLQLVGEDGHPVAMHGSGKDADALVHLQEDGRGGMDDHGTDGGIQRTVVILKGIHLDGSTAFCLHLDGVLSFGQTPQFQDHGLKGITAGGVCIADGHQLAVHIYSAKTVVAIHLTDPAEAGASEGEAGCRSRGVLGLLRPALIMPAAVLIDPAAGVGDAPVMAVHPHPGVELTGRDGDGDLFAVASVLHGDCRLPRSHAGDNTVGADCGNVLVSGLIADGAGGVEGCQGGDPGGSSHGDVRLIDLNGIQTVGGLPFLRTLILQLCDLYAVVGPWSSSCRRTESIVFRLNGQHMSLVLQAFRSEQNHIMIVPAGNVLVFNVTLGHWISVQIEDGRAEAVLLLADPLYRCAVEAEGSLASLAVGGGIRIVFHLPAVVGRRIGVEEDVSTSGRDIPPVAGLRRSGGVRRIGCSKSGKDRCLEAVELRVADAPALGFAAREPDAEFAVFISKGGAVDKIVVPPTISGRDERLGIAGPHLTVGGCGEEEIGSLGIPALRIGAEQAPILVLTLHPLHIQMPWDIVLHTTFAFQDQGLLQALGSPPSLPVL